MAPTPANPPAPPADPPADPPAPPAPPADDAGLAQLIENKVREAFSAALKGAGKADPPAPPADPPPPGAPATPPATPAPAAGDIAGLIDQAVGRALKERDSEDQLAVLAAEVAKLREAATGPAKRGWGAMLLGPGLNR